MAIGVETLVECVNCNIINSSVCDPFQILQLASVAKDLNTSSFLSVANVASLPAAADNKGRMVYIQNTCGFRFSDGTDWSCDFTSVVRDSQAWSWGCNIAGQLGDNTTTNRSSPVSIVGGFTDWCQVSAGRLHSVGLRTNKTAWAWGCNTSGGLGDNTSTNRSSPVAVVGGFTDWSKIDAGEKFSIGLRSNGTIWSWGYNTNKGALGDGTTTDRSSPVSVVGGFTDWCQISAGRDHTLALRTNGTAWAWGYENAGRLGNNVDTTVGKSSPVSVVGGFTDWCQVSAGGSHSLAIRTNGTAWAWGNNTNGRLGNNDTINQSSPISVVGGFTNWCQVSAGFNHSLALRTNGTAWAWGSNYSGKLGDGTTTSRTSPVSIVGGYTDWCQISTGNLVNLALRTNGTIWSWGCGSCGLIGDNTTTDKSSPVSVVGGFTNWCQISAGDNHHLAIRSKGF